MQTATKLPIKTTENAPASSHKPLAGWHPFENLRREVDQIFENIDQTFLRGPFNRSAFDFAPFLGSDIFRGTVPVADIIDKGQAYEITVELPGLEHSNVDVRISAGNLVIRGEKKDEKVEEKKDHYLSERYYGAFERSFRLPEGVDADKVSASVKNGVLTVTLPKTAEFLKSEKKIEVKAG